MGKCDIMKNIKFSEYAMIEDNIFKIFDKEHFKWNNCGVFEDNDRKYVTTKRETLYRYNNRLRKDEKPQGSLGVSEFILDTIKGLCNPLPEIVFILMEKGEPIKVYKTTVDKLRSSPLHQPCKNDTVGNFETRYLLLRDMVYQQTTL